jgi:choline dehydrogenase-like flavoprotein
MLNDFRDCENDAQIDTDICIIGAGAAGIAIAREFLGSNIRVVLTESGGLDPESATDMLKQGESVGLSHNGLTEGRDRLLGGTTRVWGGQCIQMDDIDFEVRSWVPESGWPIQKTDLASYYSRAEAFFDVSGQVCDERLWQKFGIKPYEIDRSKLGYKSTVWCRRPDMGKVYQNELKQSQNIQVLLHANVIKIQANETLSDVEYLDIRTLEGKTGRIRAKAFVLCSGGIENARLLLLSDGLGNGYDVVGRFFQEHPNALCAEVKTDTPIKLQNPYSLLYKNGFRYLPKIHIKADVQRQHQILNCTSNLLFEFDGASALGAAKRIYKTLQKGGRPSNLAEELQLMAMDLKNLIPTVYRRYVRGLSTGAPPTRIWLQTHAEQAPNRDSRITLSDKRDRLGLNLARVDWRLSELDRRTAEVMTKTVADDFARLNLGKLHLGDWLIDKHDDWTKHFSESYHHIGTTRMAENPKNGVVDRNCQVHGVGGLYIAGSSVFPTSGYANPTLTIVALSIRLSDYLKKTIFSSGT